MAHLSPKISPLILLLFPLFISPVACTTQMPSKSPISSKTHYRLIKEHEKLKEEREQKQLTEDYIHYSKLAVESLKRRDEEERARIQSITEAFNPTLESRDFNLALAPYLSNIDALRIKSAKSKDSEIEEKFEEYKSKLESLKKYSPLTISDIDLKSVEFGILKNQTDTCTLEVTRQGETMITYKTTGNVPEPMISIAEETISLSGRLLSWFGNLTPKIPKPALATVQP